MKHSAKTFLLQFVLSAFFIAMDANLGAQEVKKPYEPLSLFDGRLRISGQFDQTAHLRWHTVKEDKWARKSDLNTFRSVLSLETNYFITKQPTWELSLQSHLYFSYESMANIDAEYKRAMPDYTQKHFLWSRDEELVREFYFQYLRGSWDIRVGKQQVVWGEQLGIRTLDVVNPLDIRTELIGLTEWENIRIGVWMLRGIYDFGDRLPGQLSLEAIFIPFDYEPTQVPREGSFFGPLFNFNTIPRNGYLDRLISYRYYRDAARLNDISNAEGGFRLRGYYLGYDLDWSAVYFHTIDDGGVWSDGGEGGHLASDFFVKYNVLKLNVNPPQHLFDFKPYDIFGFSLQRYYGGYIDAILRFEGVYEYHRFYNKQDNDRTDRQGRVLKDVVPKDSVSWGLQASKKVPWPAWLPYIYDWSRGKYTDFDIAINQIIWRDYDRDFGEGGSQNGPGFRLNGQPHGRGDNPVTLLSWMIMPHFFDDQLIPVFRGIYYLSSPSLQMGFTLSYRPGEHWTYSIGVTSSESKRATDPFVGTETKDYTTFQVKYVF